jgi:UDP-N-acetylmuramate dehydrogenase
MRIQKNIRLARFTTFGIGGPASFFADINNIGEINEVLQFCREKKIRYFVMGGGSNLLFADRGYDGLIMRISIKGLEFSKSKDGVVLLKVGAGEKWDDVVREVVKKGLGGLENLSLIPGNTGAAACQNIGAYGVEVKDIIESVEAFDAKKEKVLSLTNKECDFGYRDSIFKHNKNLIITSVTFKLHEVPEIKIDYPDLAKIFKKKFPTIGKVRRAVIDIRKAKLIYPNEAGNAGSFFKNPVIDQGLYKNLSAMYSGLKAFPANEGRYKLSAGQLIEWTGWKGKRQGNVGVSEKHALIIVNYGGGTAKEVKTTAEKIKRAVFNKFKVKLELEVEYVV